MTDLPSIRAMLRHVIATDLLPKLPNIPWMERDNTSSAYPRGAWRVVRWTPVGDNAKVEDGLEIEALVLLRVEIEAHPDELEDHVDEVEQTVYAAVQSVKIFTGRFVNERLSGRVKRLHYDGTILSEAAEAKSVHQSASRTPVTVFIPITIHGITVRA